MSLKFNIKRGDTSPAIEFALLPSDILLGGATVRFQMRLRNAQTVIDEPAVILSEEPPVVAYLWQPNDTETSGIYQAEFRVQYFDGAIETFPNAGFIEVAINEDVEGLA